MMTDNALIWFFSCILVTAKKHKTDITIINTQSITHNDIFLGPWIVGIFKDSPIVSLFAENERF